MTINVYELVRDGVFKEAFQTGSRYICNPPPMDTDDDYMCLVSSLDAAHRILTDKGCDLGGSFDATAEGIQSLLAGDDFSDFYSYRNGDVNIIITDNTVYFDRFKFATELAKRLNLLKKEDRIALFNGVMNEHIDGYYQPVRPIDWEAPPTTSASPADYAEYPERHPVLVQSNATTWVSTGQAVNYGQQEASSDVTVGEYLNARTVTVRTPQSRATSGAAGATGTPFSAGTITWSLE